MGCLLLLNVSCSKSQQTPENNTASQPADGYKFRYATYNIGYDTPKETDNLWVNRLPIMVDLLKKKDFDIWGSQEGLDNQLADLMNGLPQYHWLGAGRTDGHSGEHCAIFYKYQKYDVIKSGDFWLSATPSNPGIGWDASLPRICTWAEFRDKASGTVFFVFNTHLDDKGVQARKESLGLIFDQMHKIAGQVPALLSGDFNFDQFDPNYSTLKANLTDAYDVSPEKVNETGGTYNGFNINHTSASRIDDIFLTAGLTSARYEIVNTVYNGKYPSDHFPVTVDLTIKK